MPQRGSTINGPPPPRNSSLSISVLYGQHNIIISESMPNLERTGFPCALEESFIPLAASKTVGAYRETDDEGSVCEYGLLNRVKQVLRI